MNQRIDEALNGEIDVITKILSDVQTRRHEIKEEYAKAWIAAVVPDKDLNMEYLMKNIELVETWEQGGMRVTWHLRFRKDE